MVLMVDCVGGGGTPPVSRGGRLLSAARRDVR